MRRTFRLPLYVVAAVLFGLLALLATLQYRWLGQISHAERERMRALLEARAASFAQDVDRELTRAYLLFQIEGPFDQPDTSARLALRYDRWQATARHPRMIAGIYVVSGDGGAYTIAAFDPAVRRLQKAEWPASLAPVRRQLARAREARADGTVLIRPAFGPLVEEIPAVVVPTPMVLFSHRVAGARQSNPPMPPPHLAYTVLVLDRAYIAGDMLPALAAQHFSGAGDGIEYRLAVVRASGDGVVYRSAPGFAPAPDAAADASTDLFRVRPQEHGALVSEVRRFAAFVSEAAAGERPGSRATIVRDRFVLPAGEGPGAGQHLSILLKSDPAAAAMQGAAAGFAATVARTAPPGWKLLVKHPAGSLETAVQSARRRNVLVSSGILAVLGASMALLVLSTRRAQRLAAQQMEFVATVSHELRTPLAVIRSAGENLADGVVRSDEQIRRYGDLVRNEGRRLTDMVEQVLEFSGIESGQKSLALRPVAVRPLLESILASAATLAEEGALRVEFDAPDALPPALGDEPALRRVFQNLVSNALKYGARGGWIGVRARHAGRELQVTVSDRGMGIAPAEQSRIFEPFYRAPEVIAAQIQGAGLGLSLVKRIVEAHGGRISLRSVPGEGSAFTVHLPVATEEPIPAEPGDARHTAPHAAGLRS